MVVVVIPQHHRRAVIHSFIHCRGTSGVTATTILRETPGDIPMHPGQGRGCVGKGIVTVMEGVSLMGCVCRRVIGIAIVTSSASASHCRQDEGRKKGGQGCDLVVVSSSRGQEGARAQGG